MQSCHGVREFIAIYRIRQQRVANLEMWHKGKAAVTLAMLQCARKVFIDQQDTNNRDESHNSKSRGERRDVDMEVDSKAGAKTLQPRAL